MPASGSSSKLSSHQMAPGGVVAHSSPPAGAIAHSRPHLRPRASFLSFSSFVSPLRPLGLWFLLPRGYFGGFRVSALVYLVRRMGSVGIALIRRVSLRVHVFLDFACCLVLKFGSAPDPFGGRGGWPWLRLLVVHVPSCWTAQSKRTYAVHQTLSLCVPVQVCIVEGAPGHNRWGVAETPLPAKSQGRTGDYTFNV